MAFSFSAELAAQGYTGDGSVLRVWDSLATHNALK
jgi:hypothetical protein